MGQELSLQELKETELNILVKIDKICREQGFRYFMCGGTLLGAVRHKGFIPWDDDIDIAMPRPDYEKFMDYCHANAPEFITVCNKFEPNYGYLFGKICDANTVIKEKFANRKHVNMGVYVDVFPVDGAGNTYKEAIKGFKKVRFKLELLVAANWKKFFKSKTHSWYYEPARFLFYLMSRPVKFSKLIGSIEKEIKKSDYDSSEFAGSYGGSYRTREFMEKDLYSGYIEMDFEGHKFFGLKNYDKYLRHVYGDYMKLPQPEERVAHHTFEAYKR